MITAMSPLEDQLTLSNSEIQAWKKCRRKWLCSYYFGLQVPPGRENPVSVARLGTRLHAALEGLYGHALEPIDVLRAAYNLAAEQYPSAVDELGKEFDLATVIIEGYYQWVTETGADRDLTPLVTERAARAQLGMVDGVAVTLQARLDAVFKRRSDRKLLFMDHKSVADFSRAATLPLDEQMKFYTLIQWMSTEKFQVGGGIYNMLKRSKRTERAKPPFYQRFPVLYNEADMTSMWHRTFTTAGEIIAARRKLDLVFTRPSDSALRTATQQTIVYPTPDATSCGWSCSFNKECVLLDDGSRWEDALENNFLAVADPYNYLDSGLLDQLRADGRV
jgi:hypothetical protein